MKTIEGKCPRCDRNGAAGSPCQTDGCRVSGVHCIPRGYHERFRQLPEAEREPLIGQRIDDYLLVDTIGEGGFGRLFVTLQLPLFMRCALKLMTVRRDVNEAVLTSMVKKFESEAMNLAQLSHPNIVRIVKYGMFRGLPYIAMEYVDNARTLKHEIRRRIRRNERFDVKTLQHIFDDILNALESAHGQQIIHLDIKPTNIMLQRITGDPHHVRILDFGLSRLLEAQELDAGTISGTPAYMAPEQILDGEVGPWTDLYAVGILLFQLLTGRRPFPGGDAPDILNLKLRSDFDPLSQLPDSAPFYLRAFFRRALARDSADRYRTVPEFRTALHWLFDNLTGDAVREVSAPNLSDILEGSDRVSRSERSDSLGRRRGDVSISDEIWRTPSLNMRMSGRTIAWASGFVLLLVAVLVGFRINAAEGVGLGLEEPDSSVRLWGDLAALAVSTHRDEALRRLAEMERLKRERMASITLPAIHVHKPKEEVEITLMTDPEGAQVIRDGETLGPTPRTWKIKRSSTMARVVVRKRGYQTQTLMLPSDRDQKVTVRMKRLPAMRNNFIRKIWKK